MTQIKTAKPILHFIKCTFNHNLYYSSSSNFKLVRYSDMNGVKIWMIKRTPLALWFFIIIIIIYARYCIHLNIKEITHCDTLNL